MKYKETNRKNKILPKFEDIQRVLGEQSVALFGLSIDFTRQSDSSPVTQHEVDTLMRFDEDTTPEEYVEALLGMCAANMWVSIPTPLFTVFQRILR